MELLDIGFVRPRQARYQAALRPDEKRYFDSRALSSPVSTFVDVGFNGKSIRGKSGRLRASCLPQGVVSALWIERIL